MEHPVTPLEQDPERWRDYLVVLAQIQAASWFRAKIDLSGVVQQTLLEAVRDGRNFKGNAGTLAAWLRRMLANNLADEFRRVTAVKRALQRERSLHDSLADSTARLGNLLAADQSSPSGAAVRAETELQLASALARLPEAQREAIILQHWRGLKLEEIAREMGRSRTAVAGLIKRGLAQLRLDMTSRDET